MARRAFAQGFLDEIGEALESAESAEGDADKTARLPVEAAFRAGVERFKAEGYRFGLQAVSADANGRTRAARAHARRRESEKRL
eukprot:3586666-Pleurochrysis_carterae.AAC.2